MPNTGKCCVFVCVFSFFQIIYPSASTFQVQRMIRPESSNNINIPALLQQQMSNATGKRHIPMVTSLRGINRLPCNLSLRHEESPNADQSSRAQLLVLTLAVQALLPDGPKYRWKGRKAFFWFVENCQVSSCFLISSSLPSLTDFDSQTELAEGLLKQRLMLSRGIIVTMEALFWGP